MTRPASAGVVVTTDMLREILTAMRDSPHAGVHSRILQGLKVLDSEDRLATEQSAQAVEGPARSVCEKCEGTGEYTEGPQCRYCNGTGTKPEPKGSEGRDQTCETTTPTDAIADNPSAASASTSTRDGCSEHTGSQRSVSPRSSPSAPSSTGAASTRSDTPALAALDRAMGLLRGELRELEIGFSRVLQIATSDDDCLVHNVLADAQSVVALWDAWREAAKMEGGA